MDKKSTNKKATKKQLDHFPGDPRYGVQKRLLRQDVGTLTGGEMLSSRLLNCLIQLAAPPLAGTSSNKVLLGSLAVRSYMVSCNALFADDGGTSASSAFKENRIKKIRSRLENVFDLENDCVNRLIIPIVHAVHFFVLAVDFNVASPDFFVNVDCYDSLRRSTRGGEKFPSSSSEIVAEVNNFLCHFVLHKPEHDHLQRTHFEVFEKLGYQECPPQNNGIDCGLFCVGVLLHLLDGKTVARNTFSHKHVAEVRLKLGEHFNGARQTRNNASVSKVIRDCFPKLQGTTIASEYGVEDVTPLQVHGDVRTTTTAITKMQSATRVTATSTTTTRSTTRALAHASILKHDNGNVSEDDDSDDTVFDGTVLEIENDNTFIDIPLHTVEGCNEQNTTPLAVLLAESTNEECEDSIPSFSSGMCDNLFEEILSEQKIDAFGALEDIDPLIEEYERKSGNQLTIKRSESNSFCLYVCREHIECTFQIFVGKRRDDGMFLVKRVVGEHSGDRRPARAADGRRHKKRRANRLNDMIVKVRNTKKETPRSCRCYKDGGNGTRVRSFRTSLRGGLCSTKVVLNCAYRARTLNSLFCTSSSWRSKTLIL